MISIFINEEITKLEDLLIQTLSEDPLKRPRFSEIVAQLEKFPKEMPKEKEFLELFKAELNRKGGIEFQQNLFQLFESFPIFLFNADLTEAERVINDIEKLVLSKGDIDELNKMKILKGDLLMCQKKFDLAEKEYLSCNFDRNQINEEQHRIVRLAILYKAILSQKNETKNDRIQLFLENCIWNLGLFPELDDVELRQTLVYGFAIMMDKFDGENLISTQNNEIYFDDYKKEIRKQTKNKEILRKCEAFFQVLETNRSEDKKLCFTEIASFLLMNFDTEIVLTVPVANRNKEIHRKKIKK